MLKSKLLTFINQHKQKYLIWLFKRKEEPNIVVLRQFIEQSKAKHLSPSVNIPFSVFSAFCLQQNITNLFSESYLNSRKDDATFFKGWIKENIYSSLIQSCYARNVFNPSEILNILCLLYVSLSRSFAFVPDVFLRVDFISELIVKSEKTMDKQIAILNREAKNLGEDFFVKDNEPARLLMSFFAFHPALITKLSPRLAYLLMPLTFENLNRNCFLRLNPIIEGVNQKQLQEKLQQLSFTIKMDSFVEQNPITLNESKREEYFKKISKEIVADSLVKQNKGCMRLFKVGDNFSEEQIHYLLRLILPRVLANPSPDVDPYDIQIVTHLAARADEVYRIRIVSRLIDLFLLSFKNPSFRGPEILSALNYLISQSGQELLEYVPMIYGRLVIEWGRQPEHNKIIYAASLLNLHYAWINAYLAREQIEKLIEEKMIVKDVSKIIMEYHR